MTKTINIKRILKLFFALDLAAVLCSLYFGFDFFINSQAGFFCSFLVTISSLISYKNMVENRVANDELYQRDILDKIEDPYELYDEEENKNQEIKTKPSLRERAQHLKLSAGGFFSLYRMVGYFLFFVIFLMLVKSGKFSVLPFFAGVSITPVAAMLYGLLEKNKK